MQKERTVLILGSGRIAHLAGKTLSANNKVSVVHVSSKEFLEIDSTDVQESSMGYVCDLLRKKGIGDASVVCVVDSDDSINIFLLMAVLAVREDVPIYATFFNESLVSSLVRKHPNIKIFNPAVVASKLFVGAIPKALFESNENGDIRTYNDFPADGLVRKLSLGFFWLLFSGAIFFRLTEGVDWQKSFYLVITVITSVNFNDAELKNYNSLVQLLRMGLMIATYVYVIVALGFVIDWIVKRRTDVLVLGRKRYKNRNHVIVCGLGRVGYAVVQELFKKNEDIIVIESNPNNKYLPAVRADKIPVLIGDATLSHYLIDAGIGKAKALISVIDNDTDNLVIGLNARSHNSSIRLLLRIFDKSTAEEMQKRLNINYAFSKSFATTDVLCYWIYCRWECEEIKVADDVALI